MNSAVGSRIGATLEGRYEVVRALSAGGMGEVYEGRHLALQRRVAIKFLRPELALRADALARFENEAKIAAAFEHENIAAVYDVGRAEDGSPYLVMEFLEGEDCSQLLRREGALTLERSASLLLQVCRGLAAAHERGVIHRDLKPGNLFVCRRPDGSEVVKILDFGIAKLRNAERLPGVPTTAAALGTPHYMSPEQACGDPHIDQRTDVYSLGVILYELSSCRRPYEGDSVLQIIHHILSSEALPLERFCPELPRAAVELVARAMARDREQRFATARELGSAVQALLGGEAAAASAWRGSDASGIGTPAGALVRAGATLQVPSEDLQPTTHAPVSPAARVLPASTARRDRVIAWLCMALVPAALGLLLYWRSARGDERASVPPVATQEPAGAPRAPEPQPATELAPLAPQRVHPMPELAGSTSARVVEPATASQRERSAGAAAARAPKRPRAAPPAPASPSAPPSLPPSPAPAEAAVPTRLHIDYDIFPAAPPASP